MIEKQYLIPECYINKVPKCDECKVELWNTGVELLSTNCLRVYQCPNCNKKYNIPAADLQGEWKWRTI